MSDVLGLALLLTALSGLLLLLTARFARSVFDAPIRIAPDGTWTSLGDTETRNRFANVWWWGPGLLLIVSGLNPVMLAATNAYLCVTYALGIALLVSLMDPAR